MNRSIVLGKVFPIIHRNGHPRRSFSETRYYLVAKQAPCQGIVWIDNTGREPEKFEKGLQEAVWPGLGYDEGDDLFNSKGQIMYDRDHNA